MGQPFSRCYCVKSHPIRIFRQQASSPNGVKEWFEVLHEIETLACAGRIENRIGAWPRRSHDSMSIFHSAVHIGHRAMKSIVVANDGFIVSMIPPVYVVEIHAILIAVRFEVPDHAKD